MGLTEPAGDGHVLEDSSPLVPQERQPGATDPRPAKQHDVGVAVVVEIAVSEVEDVDLRDEAGRGGSIFETSRHRG